jgi:cytochrome c553
LPIFAEFNMPLAIRSWVRALGAVLALGAALNAQAAGDVQRGKQLAYTCLGCHGIENYKNVYPTYSVPKLVGQYPEYLVAALKAYKNKERSHATMSAQANSLSDQDMEDVAAYLAGTPLQAGAPTAGKAPTKVAELCVACHGKDGVGITADYPTVSGQHADYLIRALEEYKRGDRKNAVMPTFLTTVSSADIKLIAEYYAAQQPALRTVLRRISRYSAK